VIFNIENFNAAREDMHRLPKYFRIILLAWVDNFFSIARDDLRKKLKIGPPYREYIYDHTLRSAYFQLFIKSSRAKVVYPYQ